MPWTMLWDSANFNHQRTMLHYKNQQGRLFSCQTQNFALVAQPDPFIADRVLRLKIPCQSESQNSIAHFIFPIASVPLKSEHQEVTFWMKANRETETKSDSKPYLFLEIFPCEFAVAIPITRKNQWELKTLDLSFLKLPLTSNAILSLIILPTPEDIFLEFGSFKIGHYDMEDDLQDAFQKQESKSKRNLKIYESISFKIIGLERNLQNFL